MPQTCEDCGTKQPSFGHLADGKMRWCGGCAKSSAHEGAVSLQQRKKCEDCGTKVRTPSFGHLADGKKRWCGGCAQSHEGAVSLRRGVELVLGVATEARRVLPAEEEFLVGVDATMAAAVALHRYWDAAVNPYPPGRMADAGALAEARR